MALRKKIGEHPVLFVIAPGRRLIAPGAGQDDSLGMFLELLVGFHRPRNILEDIRPGEAGVDDNGQRFGPRFGEIPEQHIRGIAVEFEIVGIHFDRHEVSFFILQSRSPMA